MFKILSPSLGKHAEQNLIPNGQFQRSLPFLGIGLLFGLNFYLMYSMQRTHDKTHDNVAEKEFKEKEKHLKYKQINSKINNKRFSK